MLAIATVARIKIAHLKDLYIEYRMMKISSTVRGTMISIRASARTSL